MSQHDMNIANQTFPVTRTDLNNALAALASTSLGTSAPASTRAGQLWYDSSNHKLMIRNEADDAWIALFTIDQMDADIEVGDENSAPSGNAVIKEIYSTRVQISRHAAGTEITLSESIANFDYIELIAGTTQLTASSKIKTSLILTTDLGQGIYGGIRGDKQMRIWGSGTTIRIREVGHATHPSTGEPLPGEVTSLHQILGVKVSS